MFFDAALQNIGYILLGQAIKKNSVLNDPQYFVDKTIDDAIAGVCIVDHWELLLDNPPITVQALIEDADSIIDSMSASLTNMLNAVIEDEHKVIAGTLRIHVAAIGGDDTGLNVRLQFSLLWVSIPKEIV